MKTDLAMEETANEERTSGGGDGGVQSKNLMDEDLPSYDEDDQSNDGDDQSNDGDDQSNNEDVEGAVRGDVSVSTASVEERLDTMDAKLQSIHDAMCIFKERLTELINMSNSALEEDKSKRDVVTAHQFESFVDQAILAGHEIGVGRSFIQEFLLRNFSLQPTKYLQRRLGAVLRRRVESGIYKLDKNLYSFIKND